MKATGYKGFISLEMYNPNYWKEDHLTVAKTGLKKTLAVLKKAGVDTLPVQSRAERVGSFPSVIIIFSQHVRGIALPKPAAA